MTDAWSVGGPEPGPAVEPGSAVEPGPADAGRGESGPAAADGGGPTGHPAVDQALERLTGVADEPPADQIEAYEAVHRTLQETLQTIEQG